MPIYEYDCPKCGRFDTLQRMSAPPLRRHDVCGSPVKKVMSAGSFALKGSGWYATDFRGGSSKPAEKPADTAAGGESGKGDAKPADSSPKSGTPSAAAGGCGASCACH
jgi:putative FmdB family regulatory protein